MMTYKLSNISVHPNSEAGSILPVALVYNFDYSQFALPDLQSKAKSTLGTFLGFVRQTFDGLLEVGRALQDLYFDCLRECPDGKKIFSSWLKSDDFGSSRYIATSAMEIWVWFEKLSPKIQRLVRQNVRALERISTSPINQSQHRLDQRISTHR
ncbi:hypothetical protein NIES4071_07730 [Calothrix sp. NIES-4071]|nr:hypothetical protein NIES4071_07730 [Calothrix sp. NIES-4071]BAZ55115.1 hypothetical protein NIES4105_07690 [Calothrix sp. NIES-4105]